MGSGRPRRVPTETESDTVARDGLLQRSVRDSQELHAKRKLGLEDDSPTSAPASPGRRSTRDRNRRHHQGNSEPNASFYDDEESVRPEPGRRQVAPRRVPPLSMRRAPPPELPTRENIDDDDHLGPGPGKERRPVTEAGANTTVEALRRIYEIELHVLASSLQAQSHAELRASQAVQGCQNQSRIIEARCELLLAVQGVHSEKVILEIRQRHDALECVEGNLHAARIAEAALYRDVQHDFRTLRAGQAGELDELRDSATREVQSAQAEVAVHEEVLQRYTSETASQAAIYQAELQSAVAHATEAADERHNAESLRERDAHQQAINRLECIAEESVTNQLQFALHTREYGLLQDKKLNEA